ncbi:MAG: (Na+)-NQR maturation NqrM [Pseudomonadota bacterium]|nr:(Na+)-NQR maturation NqrM [Pseudomonadota bacterium]
MTLIATFIVLLLVIAGMAVGVMLGRKPIAGSCGGIANLGLEKECGICGNDFSKCREKQPRNALPVLDDAVD